MRNIEIGKKGERYAAHYLISKGYKIVRTNYKVLGGEVDIIARYNLQLIFVEVKTRRGTNFGLPEDALGYHKLKKIKYTMFKYMHDNYYRGPFRIDLIAIELGGIDELKHLRHYKDVQLI